MNKENLNIELIKDYFAGKLDAKAMHALEKRALEDPFLAEAMEGFHEHPDNISEDLNDLQARLENRVYKKSFMLKSWLVAASVLLILGAGTYFIINNQNKKTGIAANEIVQNATIQQPVAKDNDTQPLIDTQIDASTKGTAIVTRKMKVIRDVFPSPKRVSSVNKNGLSSNVLAKKITDSTLFTAVLQGKVAGVVTSPGTQNILIIDSITQKPIPGVSVIALNNNFKATSNAQGYVHLPDTLNEVNISYIGYENKDVAVNNSIVKLRPETGNLNDVVVVGYGTQRKESLTGAVADLSVTKNNPSSANIYIRGNAALNHAPPLILIDGSPDSLNAVSPQDIASVNVLKGADATALYGSRGANGVLLIATKNRNANNLSFKKSKNNTVLSQPETGWDKFNDYIKSTVKDLDSTGAKGMVMLSFSVLPDGHLTGFKIIKGLSEERNQQAIDILKNGALWTYDATSHKGFYTIEF